jgi:hypothetical protein
MDTALTINYPPPVNQLLTYGEPPDTWPNYLELGLGPEHIPDLIRMAADKELIEADVDGLEGWAPIHAYRAIGQMRAEAAIEPLMTIVEPLRDNEWAMEELPDVFAMIGPSALPKLAEFIADSSHNEWTRICLITGVEKIGIEWPEARSECVALLMKQLELFAENDYDVNAFLILSLVKLHATEAAPLMEQAFAADRVEEFVMGNWDDVQVRLGLKSAQEVEEKRAKERDERSLRQEQRAFSPVEGEETYPSIERERTSYQLSYNRSSHRSEVASRKKAKSKMAKQSRKKNRKRK